MWGSGTCAWASFLPTQRPEQLAQEIDTLDSSKEQLLKEGENGEALPWPALPCPALACPALPICPFLLQRSWWRQSWRM